VRRDNRCPYVRRLRERKGKKEGRRGRAEKFAHARSPGKGGEIDRSTYVTLPDRRGPWKEAACPTEKTERCRLKKGEKTCAPCGTLDESQKKKKKTPLRKFGFQLDLKSEGSSSRFCKERVDIHGQQGEVEVSKFFHPQAGKEKEFTAMWHRSRLMAGPPFGRVRGKVTELIEQFAAEGRKQGPRPSGSRTGRKGEKRMTIHLRSPRKGRKKEPLLGGGGVFRGGREKKRKGTESTLSPNSQRRKKGPPVRYDPGREGRGKRTLPRDQGGRM